MEQSGLEITQLLMMTWELQSLNC